MDQHQPASCIHRPTTDARSGSTWRTRADRTLAGALLLALIAACGAGPSDAPQAASPASVPVAETPAPAPAAPAAGDPAQQAPLLLPSQFRADDSLESLRARFGAAKVRPETIPGPEGTTLQAVVIHGDDPRRRLEVMMRDEAAMRGLASVRARADGSLWRLDPGIAIGMPLSELVALNGAPVSFLGFDWDYYGLVTDWNGGALQGPIDGAERSVRLVVATGADAGAAYPAGDSAFRSDDSRYPKLGEIVRVEEIGIVFPDAQPQSPGEPSAD